MAKARSKVADYLVYLLVRLFIGVVQALSLRASLRLAEGLAWLAYHVDRRHRLVADDNLRHAFPDMKDDARDRMVRAVYRHFCTLLVEIVHLPRKMHPTTWRRCMEMVGGRDIVDALLSGRPILMVTGHFGNWELAGYALGLLGFRTYAIARRLDNPYLDDFLLNRFRQRTGQTILDKNGDLERIQAVLEAGGAVATLGDQDAGQRGLFVDFFGRPASTHKAIAFLALHYNALMLVTGTPRMAEPAYYETVAEELIRTEEYADQPDAVRALTERFTQALERLIRQHPEQYFWLHRRWKHQPKAKGAKKAA